MDLYLLRHGKAEPRGPGIADELRDLTEKGREGLATLVDGLLALRVELDLVLTSPWLRAAETARYLSPLGEPEIRESPLLVESPTEALLDEVRHGAVALVGHEPWMSELLAWITTGDRNLAGNFEMKKAGVAHVRGDPYPGGGVLVELIPPRIFRRLARLR